MLETLLLLAVVPLALAVWDVYTQLLEIRAGPAQPDTVVHVTVQCAEVEAPMSGAGKAHSCVFTETLVEAASLVLEHPPAPAT